MSDRPTDSDPPLETTGVYDMSSVRARAGRAVRDRHLLVRMAGSFAGQVVRLGDAPCTVGRARDCDLWLDDPGTSRHHARIERDEAGYQVLDLGSANGTFVDGQRVEQHHLSEGSLVQFGIDALFRLTVTDADHERMLTTLYEASVRDALTGAYNREHLAERLRSELSFARRHGTDVSLVMFDLDHFKRVNDTFGHPAGDQVLIEIAAAVGRAIRAEDVLARYGGEEFVVILRNVALAGAQKLAERLRRLIENLRIEHGGHSVRITASFGCGSLSCCQAPTVPALIEAADRRLLAAKRAGRNRVMADG